MFKILMIIYLLIANNICANEFERSEELPTLSTTNKNFIKDINSIYQYISTLNTNKVETKGTLKLNRDGYSTTLNLPISKKDFELFPKKSFNAYIDIRAYKAIISVFTISFTDRSRKITAKGKNLNDVVAVLNIAKEKLIKYNISFTGFGFRFILFFVLFFIGQIIIFKVAFKYPEKIFYPFLIIFNILIVAIISLLNWEKYFPGFTLATNQVTFLEKWSPAIGLIALILTIISIFSSFLQKKDT